MGRQIWGGGRKGEGRTKHCSLRRAYVWERSYWVCGTPPHRARPGWLGLPMSTMDITSDIAHKLGSEGSGPANFLDVGGGEKADKVATALRIILSDPKVKAILLNIFGGITRGDEVARGIIQALGEVKTNVPLIVRLAGTNAAEGRAIIDEAHLPNMQSASTLTEAAEKAIRAAHGEKN